MENSKEDHSQMEQSLPKVFLQRMEKLLGMEYEAFLESYRMERHYGLRRNPLKAEQPVFEEKMPFALEPVSWAHEGYYYRAAQQPGRHVLHEAGAYYIQEPSAMAVVEILDPQPGETILDLCAAPGGKSTQIAGRMKGDGLLVSNEIIPGRAKILSQNVERMGIVNCVVCNETPQRMAVFFPVFFDRIVVDAPCSGEGMFRKDDAAVAEWSVAHVSMCADRQRDILEEAAKMLKPGGVLVYSTCTFAPDENEEVISGFLQEHEAFFVEKIPHDDAFMQGRPDWCREPAEGIENTFRLMPHRLKGEGHYIARLRKRGEFSGNVEMTGCKAAEKQGMLQTEQTLYRCMDSSVEEKKAGRVKYGYTDKKKGNIQKTGNGYAHRKREAAGKTAGEHTDREDRERLQEFLTGELGLAGDWLDRRRGVVRRFGDQIYLVPEDMISMEGLKVVRFGLHLGTERKNRIEPAHALALALTIEETDRVAELTEEEAKRYLRGESLICGAQRGWTLLAYNGYPLGFGKASGGQIKNHYPKGLRRPF